MLPLCLIAGQDGHSKTLSRLKVLAHHPDQTVWSCPWHKLTIKSCFNVHFVCRQFRPIRLHFSERSESEFSVIGYYRLISQFLLHTSNFLNSLCFFYCSCCLWVRLTNSWKRLSGSWIEWKQTLARKQTKVRSNQICQNVQNPPKSYSGSCP